MPWTVFYRMDIFVDVSPPFCDSGHSFPPSGTLSAFLRTAAIFYTEK